MNKEQIKKAFVSDVDNIGDEAYNNQDWYQEDEQRLRYILATLDWDEQNQFKNCIKFDVKDKYQINDEQKLSELINMNYDQLFEYVEDNELDWTGDDYEHICQYLDFMNGWQDEIEFIGTDMENPDCMTILKRSREWNVDEESGFKSENKFEVAYQILMDYFEDLPEETRHEVDERLKAVNL